jgi:oligoribonuclease (3'-5' exoribonuclease)
MNMTAMVTRQRQVEYDTKKGMKEWQTQVHTNTLQHETVSNSIARAKLWDCTLSDFMLSWVKTVAHKWIGK